MVRSVRVRLELDRDEFKRGLRDVSGEMRTFDGEVRSVGKDLSAAGVEVKSTGTKVEAMGRQVDATARTTRTLGDEAGKAKQKTTGLGDETKKTGDNFKTLDTRLREARDTVRQLGEEYVKSGRSADAFAKMRTAGKDVSELEKLKKAVEHLAVDAEKAGQEAGKTFTSGLQGSLSTPGLGPVLIAGLVGAAILAAPAIGAAVASGVTLGVGGGALAAGIALAAKDPRVQQSWGRLGDDVKAQLVQAGTVFAPSLVRAADTFGATFGDRIMPSIRRDFLSLEPLVDRLAAGVAGFAKNAMPGVDKLVETAGPFIRDLADELPNLGNAVSDFFRSVSAGGPGARQFFHDILTLTEAGIVGMGNAVEFLSKAYAVMSGVGRIMRGDASGALTLWEQFGKKGEDSFGGFHNKTINVNTALGLLNGSVSKSAANSGLMKDKFADLAKLLDATAVNADTLAGKMTDKLMGSMLGMSHATLGVAESLTSIKDTFDQNGLAIDKHTGLVAMNTQAGQRNRESVLSAIESNLRMYDTQLATGVGADVAAQKYGQNTQALHDQLRAAGLTEAQVHDLIGEYGNVPGKVSTDIAMKGLADAIDGLDNLLRRLNGLTYTRTVTINQVTRHIDVGPRPGEVGPYYGGLAKGGIRAYAHGGIDYAAASGILTASNPGTILAAEPQTGGEALIPKLGISQGRAMSLASEVGKWHGFDVVPRQAPGYAQFANTRPMGGGGGGSTVNINVKVDGQMNFDGYRVGDQIAAALSRYVQNNGSNVQMAIVGRP